VRYKKQLEALAAWHRLCPVHMTKLLCLRGDFRWVGTDAEFLELGAFVSRRDASHDRIETTDRACPRHRDTRLQCERCYEGASGPVKVPDGVHTAEAARQYEVLMGRFVRTECAVGAYPSGDPQYIIAEALDMIAKDIPIKGTLRDRFVPLAKEMHALRYVHKRDA
jgi:hypothetical protein